MTYIGKFDLDGSRALLSVSLALLFASSNERSKISSIVSDFHMDICSTNRKFEISPQRIEIKIKNRYEHSWMQLFREQTICLSGTVYWHFPVPHSLAPRVCHMKYRRPVLLLFIKAVNQIWDFFFLRQDLFVSLWLIKALMKRFYHKTIEFFSC